MPATPQIGFVQHGHRQPGLGRRQLWLHAFKALGVMLWFGLACHGQTLPVPPGFVHGAKWGSPTLGAPATVTWSIEASGLQTPLTSFMPAGYDDAIRTAFARWSEVADITFVEVASGGQIKLYGQAIDGPGGVAGEARFPGSGSSFVRFDTENTWMYNPSAGEDNVTQLAMHEIGHAIGLRHPPGVIAAMDHAVTNAFVGLLPVDVAGVQAIYGPSAAVNNAQYIPTQVRTLDVLPTSSITVHVDVAGLVQVSQSTSIAGQLFARIDEGGGSASALTFYGAELTLGDAALSINNPLFTATANFTGLEGDFFFKDWFGPQGQLTAVANAQFDASQTVIGLNGGQVDYDISAPALGFTQAGIISFFTQNTAGAGPRAFNSQGGLEGQIDINGNLVTLDIPLAYQSTIELPASGLLLPVTITMEGTLHAVGVPESNPFWFGFLFIAALIIYHRRAAPHHRQ